MPKVKDIVTVVEAKDYGVTKEVLREGIRQLGGLRIKPGDLVVIKPNLCCEKSAETGATTHIEFITGIIELINETVDGNCRIALVESDAQGVDADTAFEQMDLYSLQESYPNVTLVNLSNDADMRITLKGSAIDVLEIPKTLLDCNYFISLAKLKTHVDERITCALKNQFGCTTKKYKSIFHPFLSEVIHDLIELYCPDLSIVDGIIGLEGFGPTDGSPRRANLVIMGTNAIATDIVAAKTMGFNPAQSPHLRYIMRKKDYSENDFRLIDPKDLSSKTPPFEFPGTAPYIMARSGLRLQKMAQNMQGLGEFLQKTRSAISLVGLGTIGRRWHIRI